MPRLLSPTHSLAPRISAPPRLICSGAPLGLRSAPEQRIPTVAQEVLVSLPRVVRSFAWQVNAERDSGHRLVDGPLDQQRVLEPGQLGQPLELSERRLDLGGGIPSTAATKRHLGADRRLLPAFRLCWFGTQDHRGGDLASTFPVGSDRRLREPPVSICALGRWQLPLLGAGSPNRPFKTRADAVGDAVEKRREVAYLCERHLGHWTVLTANCHGDGRGVDLELAEEHQCVVVPIAGRFSREAVDDKARDERVIAQRRGWWDGCCTGRRMALLVFIVVSSR